MNFLFLQVVLLIVTQVATATDENWCNRERFRPAVNMNCAIDNHFHHVHCWGTDLKYMDFAPPPDVEFVKIAAVHVVGCGLSKEGEIYMWGRDHQKVITKYPLGEDGFIDVSCGVNHACAIKEDNSVKCWGYPNDNRLGVPANKYFQQIECANEHTCGLTLSNTLECWGLSSECRLCKPGGEFISLNCGHGHCYSIRKSDKLFMSWGVNSHGQRNTPSGWDKDIKAYDCGYYITCAINKEDKLKCWGYNHYDMIPGANRRADNLYKDVKAGHELICALTMDNEWDCWGRAESVNQMPLYYDFHEPDDCDRKVAEVSSVVDTFATAHETSCALNESNMVICWGTGTMNVAPPTIKMKSITSSQHTTYCGITHENGVKCWGSGDHGGVTSDVPTRKDLIAVTAGHDFACAITQDYLIVCWGLHGEGREYVPVNEYYKIVENGMHASCGITFIGKIECWGSYNHHGMLNHPTDPTKQYVELQCNYGCCALDQDRRVQCWGYNHHREVSDAPVSLINNKQLAAGIHHFCVLKEDDTIHCWGRNTYGESTNPAGNDWLALGDMGIHSSCAMTKSREIKCWGQNNKGQLNVPDEYNWLPPGDGNAKKRTWLAIGKGNCPDNKQTGGKKTDLPTVKQCRDHCFDVHYETYFSMTTEPDGSMVCTCFKDCDTLSDADNVAAYEVLSEHVGEEFQTERQMMIDYQLRFGKSLDKVSFLEKKLTTMSGELSTTEKNLKDMTANKRMYEERFNMIETNELSKLAKDEFPSPIYESSVGSSNLQAPPSAPVFNWLSTVVAVGVGVGIGLFLATRSNMKEERQYLL